MNLNNRDIFTALTGKQGEESALSYFLEMKRIIKQFSGNCVLKNVNLCVRKGEVHALVGENGAGKSTLMKILAGVLAADSGEIYIDGQRVQISNPKQAQDLGISMIFQGITIFPDLNVAENVFIQREPLKDIKLLRLIDWDRVYKETKRYLDYLGLDINPKTQVRTLSVGQQKFVEIIKALSQNAKIIIMDEATSALTEQEIEILFRMIRDVKKLGVTIIYISHRLEEIKKIADSVTVLRDGEVIETTNAQDTDINRIVKMMAGKDIEDRYPKLQVKIGKEVLRVEDLGFEDRIRKVSFNLRSGEILGITGLSGSGRRTLAKTLFGINRPYDGRIYINNKLFRNMTPQVAIKNGLCYVTGIRTSEGLMSTMPVLENITITNLQRVSKKGFLLNSEEFCIAQDFIKRLEIKADVKEIVQNLSGGNQKKVIFAKWLLANARILIIEEPTSGIDISAKIDVYNIINELVRSGASVIMISSDLSEVMGMCDRIAVLYNGEIRKIFDKEEATQEKILYFASGGKEEND